MLKNENKGRKKERRQRRAPEMRRADRSAAEGKACAPWSGGEHAPQNQRSHPASAEKTTAGIEQPSELQCLDVVSGNADLGSKHVTDTNDETAGLYEHVYLQGQKKREAKISKVLFRGESYKLQIAFPRYFVS